MGKKHRSKQGDKSGLNMKQRKHLLTLAADLFKLCVSTPNRSEEWEYYLKVYEAVSDFQKKHTAMLNSARSDDKDRHSSMPAFQSWLKENGATQRHVQIHHYGLLHGFGIIATEDIKADEPLLQVPRTMMFSYEDAKNSYLKDVIENNEVLSVMPNVCLALYLHCEACNPLSKFKPYIDILPKEFNTTLYFTPDEMKYLKGSSVLSAAINQYRSIVRQFAMLYKLLSKTGGNQKGDVDKIDIGAREAFTFDAYRWCVSAVTTRQNKIPRHKDEKLSERVYSHQQSTLALIPLWDMFNHAVGPMSTTYDMETDKLECLAMSDFKKGEQVTICYGGQSNSELLVHNGFVVRDNPFDKVKINLGVSPKDPLFTKKTRLLAQLNCEAAGQFTICSLNGNLPTSPDLLAFLRIFHMSEGYLDEWLSKKGESLFALREVYVSTPSQYKNDSKMWKFLENRVTLLLLERKKYLPNNIEELLSSDDTCPRMKLALQLQVEERKVLESCVTFCQKFQLAFEKHRAPDFQQLSNDILQLTQGVKNTTLEKAPNQSIALSESVPESDNLVTSETANGVNGNAKAFTEEISHPVVTTVED